MVLDCLATLAPQAQELSAKIVVVDNHSGDESVPVIQGWIDKHDFWSFISLKVAAHNGGFAAGNNIGISSEIAEYYLLINSDTLLRENALKEMLDAISVDSKIGLLSPRLEWPDGRPQESCFRFHHPLSQLIASAKINIIRKLLSGYEVALRVSDEDADYDWTSFACVMIRKKVLDQLGGLDEKFFMYFEDVEFCWRARSAGWIVRNRPEARVVHLRGGSSPVKSNKAQRKRQAKYFYESRTRYFFLVYGRCGLFFANILWTFGWILAKIRSVFQRNFVAPACKMEWCDIWTNFFDPKKPYVHPEKY